ncbi:beta-N-acetylhexosaminidase [Streptomyces sp. NBC_01198]|uniref:beta-N-acetylhexosaminidase n=1 Tax=Streptomyces sp. NBC_01198 TaxID=2903769 RepID=UPI002E12E09A|nr:beta-N-acetylhexosaminidase [Streptomyces sp. NBC_01198]
MIIPEPARSAARPGSYALGPATTLSAEPALAAVAAVLREQLAPPTGCSFPDGPGGIVLGLDGALAAEEYRMSVTPEGVRITAGDAAGAFYGVQTLRQLLPPPVFRRAAVAPESGWEVPCVEIEDRPRFGWRGCLLDVARHFVPKADVLRLIDLLALHKLNVLHLHLTDDQGWRLEIRRYPRLTEVGAWRRESSPGWNEAGDGRPHGGYFTQDDIREIVAFAAARHVTVVPEVDIPGHTRAAIAAYPELGHAERPLEVGTRWGVGSDILNVAEPTLNFFHHVFEEVMELFPGPYISVGGDECPKDQWRDSPAAQARIRELGLGGEDELQSWFIGRFAAQLTGSGRRLLGWDEILEGGLPPGATVVSWRDHHGAVRAAEAGHDVVTSPARSVYLDYRQSGDPREPVPVGTVLSLAEVHAFEPVPAELRGTPAQDRVIGAQCALWTEAMDSPRVIDYHAFPRLSAFAETVWCTGARDFAGFTARLPAHLRRLDAIGVEYRRAEGPLPWQTRPGVRGRPVELADYLAGVAADTRNIREA